MWLHQLRNFWSEEPLEVKHSKVAARKCIKYDGEGMYMLFTKILVPQT